MIHLNYFLSIASTLLLTVLSVPSTFSLAEAQESVAADKPVEVQDAVTLVSPTSPKSELAVSRQVCLHSLVEVPSVSIEYQVAVSLYKPEATSLAFGTDLIAIALPELDQPVVKFNQDEPFSLPLVEKTSTTAADLEMATDESTQFPLWDRLLGPTQVVQTPNDSEPPNTNPAQANPEQAQASANLAQEAQNPIANLISVPLQNNFNFNVGPFNRTQYILNIQPVIPVPLSKDLLLVTRTIVPLVSQPTAGIDPTTQELRPGNPTFGLGDINPQFFFVPKTGSNLTWGVGPTFLLPTPTDEVLGTGKWGAGLNGVLVWTSGKWLVGALVN